MAARREWSCSGDMANRDHLIIADAIVSKKKHAGNDDDPAG